MELWKELLIQILSGEQIEVTFPNLHFTPEKLIELRCYQALKQIKSIIEDDALDDPDCFLRIEEIVRTLGIFGSGGGSRHDF